MKQMKNKLKKLYKIVESQSRLYDKKENVCENQTFDYHIKCVIENAIKFAKERGGDIELVEIAALFHDYANLIDEEKYGEIHHIMGGELAEPILLKHGYSQDFVNKVKQCIFSHRASIVKEKTTIEEICLADADGVTHIENVVEVIMWRGQRGDSIEDGNLFVKNKIKKTYAKLSDWAKEYIKDRYEATMKIFY